MNDAAGIAVLVMSVLVLLYSTHRLAFQAGRYKETGKWPE